MQFERVHRGNVTAVLLALAVLAASCKRVPLHDASAQVYLEIAQALDQPMVVPDTIDLASNPAYYEKYHIPEPAKMVACFYDPTTHALVDKEYVGPFGGHINELSPGTYDLMVYQLGTLSTQTENDDARNAMRAFTSIITKADPVITEPDHIMAGKLASVTIPHNPGGDESVLIHVDAQTALETWAFIAKGVTGIENVKDVRAMISHQANSKFLWSGQNPNAPVYLPSTAVSDPAHKCFYGVYNTFGNLSGQVVLHLIVTNHAGAQQLFGFDVTDQITDPLNVNKIIRVEGGIDISSSGGTDVGGYDPYVHDWDEEIIIIPIN